MLKIDTISQVSHDSIIDALYYTFKSCKKMWKQPDDLELMVFYKTYIEFTVLQYCTNKYINIQSESESEEDPPGYQYLLTNVIGSRENL